MEWRRWVETPGEERENRPAGRVRDRGEALGLRAWRVTQERTTLTVPQRMT